MNSSIWIDKKWIGRVGMQLDQFKWTGENANFRCPICGDSKKNALKCRAYFLEWKGQYFMKCHNCGVSMPFGAFLKSQFPEDYKEYKMDLFESQNGFKKPKKPKTGTTNIQDKLPAISTNNWIKCGDLDKYHKAREYIINTRKIPEDRALNRIFYTEDFASWVKLASDTYDKYLPKDERILFPLRNTNNELVGVQGRSLNDKSDAARYLTVKFNDAESKIYGREYIDRSQDIIVVEGPIDSLFLPNALALCGGDISNDLEEFPLNRIIVALDNEPRNKDTIARMNKAIDKGYRVVFWDLPTDLKDINNMVLSGISIDNILEQINTNSFYGLAAKATMSNWKRI